MSEGRASPAWLLAAPGPCPCASHRGRRRSHLTQTLAGTAGVVRQAVFADDVARRRGVLQRVDPRVKVIGLLALLVAVSLSRSVAVLLAVSLLAAAAARASLLPLRAFAARAWLVAPAFTALIALPATTNLVTPGTIAVPLGTWFGHPVGLTEPGLVGAALLVTRVTASVSLVVLVTLTTPWPALLASMRTLRVPRSFVAVLALAHRYLFHLLGIVDEVYLARRSRLVALQAARDERRFVAGAAGTLFGKAHHLSGEVHQAMVARGWTGEIHVVDRPRLAAGDLVALVVALVAAAAIVVVGSAGG